MASRSTAPVGIVGRELVGYDPYRRPRFRPPNQDINPPILDEIHGIWMSEECCKTMTYSPLT